MIKNKFKLSLLATAMICAAGFSGVSSAHDTTGALGASVSAIDVYHTSCFTWTAAGAAAVGQSALPTKRFVGRVAKKCVTADTACGATGGNVKISIGAKDTTANAAATGATATATANTGGALNGELPGVWTATPSSWVQVANTGTANKNGDYLVAVGHETAVASNYWVQFHCEAIALGASPSPANTNDLNHSGTGVTATGGSIASPGAATGGDWNQFINQ
jgi:hypothetical protein